MSRVKIFLFWQFIFFFSLPVLAQVDTAWVVRYDGPVSGVDQANALGVDASGNVYVTGNSDGGVTGADYATIKYKANGDTAWVRRYNGPVIGGSDQATALAVDGSGNVYVTGNSWNGSSSDYATIKYKPNGDTAWVRRYNGPGDGNDGATALGVDASGNVYITGWSWGGGTFFDYATIKYKANGDTAWVRRYDGGDYDQANALGVDAGGNVYVTGNSVGAGTLSDYATIKYASDGTEVWVKRYNGSGNGNDVAYALAVDDFGRIYVTGGSTGSGTDYDYTTIKYASNGDTLWVRRYDGIGGGLDAANALTVDVSGNVYVTGNSLGSGTGNDYATLRYTSGGTLLWDKRYDGPGNGDDIATALRVNTCGNVYVTGYSTGSGTFYDYATLKYNSNGDILWDRRYNGPGNGDDYAYALAVSSSGNAYVTGGSFDTLSLDYATIKYPGTCDSCRNLDRNHYKTWRIQKQPLDTSVFVEDQFMQDTLRLDTIDFLSNPAHKVIPPFDTFKITEPDHHLNWYRAKGKDTLIHVVYVNQFESTTVDIDSVKYLLVPAQKSPHPFPESLDHYKCYRIKKDSLLIRHFRLKDQFDSLFQSNQFELIDSVRRAYFCTPCQKDSEPTFDTLTHYVAYTFRPDTLPVAPILGTFDQFGFHPVQVYQSEMVLVPTCKKALGPVCTHRAGDVDGNGNWTLTDIVGLVGIVFKGAPKPTPLCRTDCNGTGGNPTLTDIVCLVSKVFKSGPNPVKIGVCCL